MADWRTLTMAEAYELPDAEAYNGPGVYFCWYKQALTYIGASRGVSDRMLKHWRTRRYGELHTVQRKYIMWDKATVLKCDIRYAAEIESDLIKRFEPGLAQWADAGNRWTFNAPESSPDTSNEAQS